MSTTTQAIPRDWRRRSADVGGLHLALASRGGGGDASLAAVPGSATATESWEDTALGFGAQGQGWMGGEPGDVETIYAELLSDMYTSTLNSVNDNSLEAPPPPTPNSVRSRLIWSLNRWNFEPHRLPDDEVLACALLLFETLFRVEGMEQVIPLSMQQITSFIHHLRRIYRLENTYHNFEHALDVLHATQSYLKSAGVVPPPTFLFEPPSRRWVPEKKFNSGSLIATLGLRELFILYVAAIGHDVGHPGFTNVFMKNAQAPLSVLFNTGSALEHMHCQLLLRVMRVHGFAVLLDDPQHGAHLRKILLQSVLATDMGVHEEFMGRLHAVVDGEMGSLCLRQVVLCQAILKNADISNPTRPFLVSKHWASALMQEWSAQAHLEASYHLQPTVMSSSDPIKEADSQIFFIQKFARPLLDLTQRAVPEMRMYTNHCRMNLQTWQRKRKELVREQAAASMMGYTWTPSTSSSSGSSTRNLPPNASPPPLSSSISTISSCTSLSQLSSTPLPPPPLPPVSPAPRHGYGTAFPLTLPTLQPPAPPPASSFAIHFASDQDSAAGSVPDSPTESESMASGTGSGTGSGSAGSSSRSAGSVFSPVSESSSSHSHRYPSNASTRSISGGLNGTLNGVKGSNLTPHANVNAYVPVVVVPPQQQQQMATSHAAAAIRAASKVGSLRKKSQTGLNALGGLFGMGNGNGGGGNGVGAGAGVGGYGGYDGDGIGIGAMDNYTSIGKGAAASGKRNSWCVGSGAGLAGLFLDVNVGHNGHARAATNGSNGKSKVKTKTKADGADAAADRNLANPNAKSTPNLNATLNPPPPPPPVIVDTGFLKTRPIKLQVSP